jgi:hypothetical protein
MTRILRLLLIAAIALPLWQPVAAETITVCSGSGNVSSEFVPVYGYWIDTQGVESQVIYPASKFNGLTGGNTYQIDAITFYSTAAVPASLGGATVVVRMGETYNTTISTRSEMVNNRNAMDVVYRGQLPFGTGEMTIEFQTPYVYQGNNIMIDIYVEEPSENCDHCNWIGEEQGGDITAWNSKDGGESFLPKMKIAYSEFHEQVLDFGKRLKGDNVSYTEAVTVANSANATEVKLENGAPFSILSRNGDDITIKFAPTDASSYTDYLIVKIDGKNTIVRITGIGIGAEGEGPVATRDEAFFKGITYTWPIVASNGLAANSKTSNLSEIATDPDQIIAMLRKVYMDQSIPGNLYRSNAKGNNDDYNDVLYTGVGTITRTNTGSWGNPNYVYSYNDAYGWNIEGTIQRQGNANNPTNHHFQIDEYKPEVEGVTLLLLEQVDTFNPYTTTTQNGYTDLRKYIAESIKSARVITEAKRTGDGQKAGTLFKIDCDKMNNFFFLAKGQLLGFENNGGSYGYPNYNGYSYHDYAFTNYMDTEPPLFCHMFEQFSPAQTSAGGAPIDVYQSLVNMESFPVVHDCPNVPYCYGSGSEGKPGGHGFKMYNSDYSGDAADVRDMMFFVPDYRMMYHSNRNSGDSNRDYFIYNTEYAPTMGLYVITQDPIKGEQVDGKDMYQLTLTWDSNLDDYLPSDQQEYQLFQVVVNEDGVEEYTPVYYMNSDGQYLSGPNGSVVSTPVPVMLTLSPNAEKKYTEVYIPMQESSQQVTFAVRGQDATHFLDLKTSNLRDFVIPGLDPNELVEITDLTHYSRFNPQTVKNCYSNKIGIANTALGLVNANITGDTKLTVIRSCTETVNGATTTSSKPIAEITFDKANSRFTVTMLNQSGKSEYPNGKSSGEAAGYHYNNATYRNGYSGVEGNGNWQQNYTVDSDVYVNFGSLEIYDNFVVGVADNAHPNSYTYQLTSNYPGQALMLLNAATCTNGDEAWYAYTWIPGNSGDWIKGTKQGNLYKFYYNPTHTKIIFARIDPSKQADWDNGSVWNQTQDLDAHDGGTYALTSWHDSGDYNKMSVEGDGGYTAPAADYSSMAHSNSFDIRVYKTDSDINNVYTLEQVDAEKEIKSGDNFENDDLTFEEKLQYSSKKDILRYDVYRWGETEARFIINKVVSGKDNEEEDLSPDGQADNQDGWYTTKMNTESQGDVTVPQGSTNKWAAFFDNVPENESTAKAFTYAPVVETFTKGKTADNQNRERTDYNTYGGPLQNAATGKFAIAVETPSNSNPLMSEYSWTKNGKKYVYYNLLLKFNNVQNLLPVPAGYKIYKVRVWREVDEKYLGEQFDALQSRVSDCYKFDEIVYTEATRMDDFLNKSYALGSAVGDVDVPYHDGDAHDTEDIVYYRGTFGAQKVRTNEPESDTSVLDENIDVGFFARIYFTREANLAALSNSGAPIHTLAEGDLPADGKFYMVEAKADYTIKPGNIPTAVENLNARQVVGVKYYNVAGIESSTPFDGVNIVVTRYSDGSTTTTKILK